MTDDQQPSSSSSAASSRDQQRSKRLSGFFNHLIHRREPPAPIQEETSTQPKSEDPPQPAPAVPPPRLPPPTLQELGLSLSVVTADLHPSHFTTPPSSGAFLSPNYLLLCHAQGLDVLPITSPPEPQPLPLIRRVSFKSIVVMEQRGVLVAIAGRRDGVRVYALEEIRKAVEWRIDVQIRRERERQKREQAKKLASAFVIESRVSTEKARKPSSSTPPPGAQASAKVSMPRKSSHSSMNTIPAPTQSSAPPVPLIPRTPTTRKTKTPPRRASNTSSSQVPPEPSGHPPPYTPPPTDYFSQPSAPVPMRSMSAVTARARGASVSEVLSVPPISRINTTTDLDRPRDPDAKDGWVESSDDEAINVVAAGSSGSQALDERTSAIHSSPTNNQITASTPQITTTPSPTHRRSLSRRNRPANLDLSLTLSNPVAPSEPSPAPTLLTLRQALASESNRDHPTASLGDVDDDDDDDGEISLTQALLESRIPDLPPPGSTRPQQPIFLSSSHSLVAGDDEPASPRPSDAHSSLTTRSETITTSSAGSNNRRRRWSLMIGGSSSNPSVDQSVPQSPTSASLPNTADPATSHTPREHRSPNRLTRSHSHRSGTSPTPSRRPASAHAEPPPRSAPLDLAPPLPSESASLIPSASRSRFIPRIISNAFNNMRSEDRPSTSPGGLDGDSARKTMATSMVAPPPAAKLEYVKLPGTKGSLMIKAVETAKKSFLAILCGENGEKVELFAGTYRTALGLSRTFILPDSPRSLELQLQGDDLVEVFLVFSQNVFGLEPATVRVREVRIGRAERRAARRRAREARADAASASAANDSEVQGEDETNVNVSIGVSVSVGSTVIANGTGSSGPQTPALIPSEHPQQQQEDRDRERAGSNEGNGDDTGTPAEGVVTTSAIAHAEELVALATAQMGPYTTFQQLSFAPQFPLASIADEYVIPPTYPDFLQYREFYEREVENADDNGEASTSAGFNINTMVNGNGHANGSGSESSSADATQVQFSPPGLPLPTPTAPSKWFYKDPRGVVHGPWRASLMQSWYKDSLLPPDLPVRREEDTEFILLKDLRQQSVDPTQPFNPVAPTSSEASNNNVYQSTDKPLLKPISLLAQPRHFGPPALFYSSRGGHSTTIVDARGRSVLKERFFWSDDETIATGDDDSKPASLTGGRMGDVKRLEAVDIKDRSVLIAMRQGGVEAVDLSDALLRPADDSRGTLPQFNPAPSTVNRRAPFVWRIGTPVSSSPTSQTSTVLSSNSSAKQHKSGLSGHSMSMTRPSRLAPAAKSPAGKMEFNVGDADSEFHDEVLFLGRKENEIYICERNAGSFRILRLSPTS
ncbi:gyf domain protein [Moniliophthora roreri MCA 2997]|uniref:Gyf domain protein n=1 Tax=Moniliophthora roreri (strain MCA 2997) TaxID=1381753 RepID=V2Y0R0_MONRO|nr:gyf domain protein [Moniliophthora roreri MCA 2997]